MWYNIHAEIANVHVSGWGAKSSSNLFLTRYTHAHQVPHAEHMERSGLTKFTLFETVYVVHQPNQRRQRYLPHFVVLHSLAPALTLSL